MIKIGRYHIIEYKGKKLDISASKYVGDKRTALMAQIHETGEPFAVLTVNIPAYDKDLPDPDYIILDANNVPDILSVLLEAGLVEIPEKIMRIQSGFCMYPVVRWIG